MQRTIEETRTGHTIVLEIEVGPAVPDLVVSSRRGFVDPAQVSRLLGWLLLRKTPLVATGDHAFDDVFQVRTRDLDAVPGFLTRTRREALVAASPHFTSLTLRRQAVRATLTRQRASPAGVARARDELHALAAALA